MAKIATESTIEAASRCACGMWVGGIFAQKKFSARRTHATNVLLHRNGENARLIRAKNAFLTQVLTWQVQRDSLSRQPNGAAPLATCTIPPFEHNVKQNCQHWRRENVFDEAHKCKCSTPPRCWYVANTLEFMEVIVFGSQGIVPLRTPDARSAQSNIVIVRFQSYAPTLRCRCGATPCLANDLA